MSAAEGSAAHTYDKAKGVEMPPGKPPNTQHATPEEIGEAIEQLSDIEFGRLRAAAKYSLFGTEYTDPDELLGEAVKRSLDGTRRWPRGVEFVAFLIRTMESIASGSFESPQQRRTSRIEAMAGPDGDAEQALAHAGFSVPDVVEEAIEVEESAERRQRAIIDSKLIEDHFAGDDEIQMLIMGDKDEMKPADIQALAGMTQTQYDSARRRFRRGLNILMPGRSKK